MNVTRGPQHAPRVPFAVLVAGLLVGGLALLLVLNTASAANELRRHGLAGQDASIAAQVEQLRNAVAASSAPANLADAAGALGMVPANDPAFVMIRPDGSVRVLGSPGPARAPVLAVPHKKTPTPTPTATPSKSTGAGARSTGAATRTGRATKGATSAPGSPRSSATKSAPTPTPTPTVTLPGGPR